MNRTSPEYTLGASSLEPNFSASFVQEEDKRRTAEERKRIWKIEEKKRKRKTLTIQ
jgi:hypothetical protein